VHIGHASSMILTWVSVHLTPEQGQALQATYERSVSGRLAPGAVQSFLLHDGGDQWCIATLWLDRTSLGPLHDEAHESNDVASMREITARGSLQLFDVVASRSS
jgi:hypothetical protein